MDIVHKNPNRFAHTRKPRLKRGFGSAVESRIMSRRLGLIMMQARVSKGVTVATLAKRLSTHKHAIFSREKGLILIRISDLIYWCDALDVKISDILETYMVASKSLPGIKPQ